MTESSGILQALSLGSGVDVAGLARTLAEAETRPRIDQVQERLDAAELTVSAYGLVRNSLTSVKSVFEAMNDAKELARITAAGFDTAVVGVTTDSTAVPGEYTLTVSQLAAGRSVRSDAFSAADQSLNGGGAFDLDITLGASAPVPHTVTVTTDTPQGIVDAINGAGLGLQATLVNRSAAGNEWYVVVQGETGAEQTFTLSSVPDLGFATPANELAAARNARFTVNGLVDIERDSNRVDDVVSGLTFDLKQVSAAEQRISVNQSYDPLRSALNGVVVLFNDLKTVLDELVNAESTANELSGSLKRDKSLVTAVLREVQGLIGLPSSTPSGDFNSLRDLGFAFAADGTLTLDSERLNAALENSAADVVMMLSAGTNDQSPLSAGPKGLAQDAMAALDAMLDTNGVIQLRITRTNDRIDDYELELLNLESRLEAVRIRYLEQFAVMESFVERSQGIGNYLKGQFEAMANAYD